LHSPTSLENSSCTSEENPIQLRTSENPLKLRDNAKLAAAGDCLSLWLLAAVQNINDSAVPAAEAL
jgi:hypothetical protein